MPMTESKMLTKPEVEEMLGLSDKTVTGMLDRGDFPGAFKLGDSQQGRWRIPLADVEAFKARRRDAAKA